MILICSFLGWRLLRKKSSLPNGFPRNTGSDHESNSDGSDSARTQIEFPTWNSHESTQRFLDTAEDKRYYRIWIDPSSENNGSASEIQNKRNSSGTGSGDRYETVFPSSENPPPLPPRSYQLKHRPLERTKAIEHCSSSPPKVSRHYKPCYPCDAPVVPPRPLKKFINPEDAFNFEIIDIDEQSELKNSIRNGRSPLLREGIPLATPESDCIECTVRNGITKSSGTDKTDNIINNHSSQNCDIKVVIGRSDYSSNEGNACGHSPSTTSSKLSKGNSQESLASSILIMPENTHLSSNSFKVGCQDSSGSNTGSESDMDSNKINHKNDANSSGKIHCDGGVVRGHRVLSRQISHPPDHCTSQFLRKNGDKSSNQNVNELQCPPTPTHHARRFKINDKNCKMSCSARQIVATQSPIHRHKVDDLNSKAVPTDSSNSDSDVPSNSIRQRMVRLPSISENSQIQKVETLPDGDRLPPG